MTRPRLPHNPLEISPHRRGRGQGEPAPHPVPPVSEEIPLVPVLGPQSGELLITIEEAARRLAIGRSHLYRYIDNGRLRSIRLGRSRRVTPEDLAAFVDQVRAAGIA